MKMLPHLLHWQFLSTAWVFHPDGQPNKNWSIRQSLEIGFGELWKSLGGKPDHHLRAYGSVTTKTYEHCISFNRVFQSSDRNTCLFMFTLHFCRTVYLVFSMNPHLLYHDHGWKSPDGCKPVYVVLSFADRGVVCLKGQNICLPMSCCQRHKYSGVVASVAHWQRAWSDRLYNIPCSRTPEPFLQ